MMHRRSVALFIGIWLHIYNILIVMGFHHLFRGKGSMQKKVEVLRELRRLLSRSEIPPVEAAIQAGVIPILLQCLSFGSPDEQVGAFYYFFSILQVILLCWLYL